MIKFLTLTGVFFIIAIAVMAAICFFIFIMAEGAKFMDYVENKYGAFLAILTFFALLAIVSSVAATISILTGM